MVETNLPAQHAENQSRGQVAVSRRESVDGFAAQQIVGVGLAALDGQKNLEGRFARWRNAGIGHLSLTVQPKRASAASRRSAQKFGGGEALFAFELEFEEFQPSIFGAADEQTMVFDADLARRQRN